MPTRVLTERPPYTRMAFDNVLNWGFLAFTGALTYVQFGDWGWVTLAAGASAELAWLSVGTRLPPARRYFDALYARTLKKRELARQQELLRAVRDDDRRRFLDLERVRHEIEKECRSNPTLTMDLVRLELGKIDELLTAFLLLAATAARYESHIEQADLNAIEADLRRQEAVLEKTNDPDARDLAQRNLDILKRRIDKAGEVRRLVRQARGQLNLFENTFRLLRDQIVTMQSPEELSGQLAELTASVDSIAASGKETDALVRRLDGEIAALKS